MEKIKITLDREMETLLVPLMCRAREQEQNRPILTDPMAARFLQRVDYDFSSLKVPKKTRITLCIRAKQFDRYTRKFLDAHPFGTVIHLGCGLDTRYFRLTNGDVEWYDLDYPDVIALRRQFSDEKGRYHLIPSSVTDLRWIDSVADKTGPFLIIAEGLFMYLHDEDVKSLLLRLQQTFPGSLLVFDCFSTYAAKRMADHPSLQKSGAEVFWGIDNTREIENWNKNISLIDEWYFIRSDEINNLALLYSILFKIAGLLPFVNKAHRILVFRLD